MDAYLRNYLEDDIYKHIANCFDVNVKIAECLYNSVLEDITKLELEKGTGATLKEIMELIEKKLVDNKKNKVID